MAKRLIWSERAKKDLKEIFTYWNTRNKSKLYSRKLNKLFEQSMLMALQYPEIGRISSDNDIRVRIVRDYLLFYESLPNEIIVLSVWYGKQNPEKLNFGEE